MGPISEGRWRQRCVQCGNHVLISGVITGISGFPATATRATARRVRLTRRSACCGPTPKIQNSPNLLAVWTGRDRARGPMRHAPLDQREIATCERGYGGGRVWRGWNVAVGAAGATHDRLGIFRLFLKTRFLFFIFAKQ